MNANQKYLKKSLLVLSVLLLLVALIGMTSGASVSSVQAAPRRTKTPRPTATQGPILTPTPTPFAATSTPAGPACWSVVPAPDVPGYGARLLAIAGSSDNDVWAVGWFLENNSRHNLALHWNGSTWERVPVPDVVSGGDNSVNGLYGVAAIAPNDVWAVGYAVGLSTPYRTVTLHWNGSAWQVVPSPNLTIPGSYNALNAVVAISSNDIWAVGGVPFDLGGINGRALLMHWEGSAWQLFPEPPEVVNWYTTTRFGVAARASNDVWAVGQFAAWHWDGSTWSVPSGFSGQNLLGTSANGGALWSAGTNPGTNTSEGGYFPASPNAQFFNGTTWQTTSPVRDAVVDTAFHSIKVLSPSNVWAVGRIGNFVLTERWDGSQWTRVEAANGNPNPPADQAFGNRLYAVNGSSTGLWAVGSFDDAAGVERILIERYTCP
jgi:hypothetical protein